MPETYAVASRSSYRDRNAPRRAFLATFALSIASLTSYGEPQTENSPTETDPETDAETTDETGTATGPSTSDLDRQEANGAGVAPERRGSETAPFTGEDRPG